MPLHRAALPFTQRHFTHTDAFTQSSLFTHRSFYTENSCSVPLYGDPRACHAERDSMETLQVRSAAASQRPETLWRLSKSAHATWPRRPASSHGVPHPETLYGDCPSAGRWRWRRRHIFSDILFWRSFWHSILTFFSGILPGIYSDIVFGILSGIYFDIFSGILSGILSDNLSGIYFDILSGIPSGILSDIFLAHVSGISSDIFSGILSGISWEILCGWGPAGITLIQRLLLRSGGDHCDLELAVDVRRRRKRKRRRRRMRRRRASWHKI